jgi:hypothetical protein
MPVMPHMVDGVVVARSLVRCPAVPMPPAADGHDDSVAQRTLRAGSPDVTRALPDRSLAQGGMTQGHDI